MTDIVERARLFAVAAHSAVGQVRKYTGEPYWHHLEDVVSILSHSAIKHDDEMLAAAWLHDVLEDTKVTSDVLWTEFGDTIAGMVVWLTNPTLPQDGNRKTRAAITRAHLSRASDRVQTIKLADIMSNCKNIASLDPAFAAVYLVEKGLLLDELVLGDTILQINTRALLAGQMAKLAVPQDQRIGFPVSI